MIQEILRAATGAVPQTDVHAIGERDGERRVHAAVQSIGGHRLLLVVVPRAGGALFARRRGRSGQDRHRAHHQRCRLLHRRRHGLLPRGKPGCVDHGVQFRGANDCPARHRRTRCRWRHGVGGLLQRGRARHRHEDRGRSGLDQAGLRLFVADGAQGPRRQRTLQDLRRSQGHEGCNRCTRHRYRVGAQLKKGGLRYGDVDVVYIGFPEHLPAYKNKGIDASITNEPTMTRAIEDGVAVRVAGNDVTYPDQQPAVTFLSDHFSSGRRKEAERFMRAYLRGVRMYNDALKDGRLAGPKANEVIAILVKYTTIKDESMFRRMVPSYCNPDGEVNVASLRKDLQFFRELGLIEKKDVSVDGEVDASFETAAVAKRGAYVLPAN